jgi:hypothetical protein
MGRRISKEFLHPSILEGVNNKIGNLDSLETDAKGNMVQAINELVEKLDNSAEIENGKELIANAVGEPLTAEESFDEMSTDINNLLSTFKTNMMNNGVTVESSDRFKALIDKIATLADNEGKGIQFAEGTGSWKLENDSHSGQSVTIITNLNFTPTYVFVYGEYAQVSGSMMMMGNASLSIDNIIVSNLGAIGASGDTTLGQLSISNITANSFTLKSSDAYYYKISATKWFAIGVGEEDTTLRDSLASILQDEGVDVTEEDDMASLITKVDEEFDRKNDSIVTLGDISVNSEVTSSTTIGSMTLVSNEVMYYDESYSAKASSIESSTYKDIINYTVKFTGTVVVSVLTNAGGNMALDIRLKVNDNVVSEGRKSFVKGTKRINYTINVERGDTINFAYKEVYGYYYAVDMYCPAIFCKWN